MSSRLYPEDQQRVDEYLRTPVPSVDRKPFKVWWLLIVIIGSVTGLGLLARLLAALALA